MLRSEDRCLRFSSFHTLLSDDESESCRARACSAQKPSDARREQAHAVSGASSIHQQAAVRVSNHVYDMMLRIDLTFDLDFAL